MNPVFLFSLLLLLLPVNAIDVSAQFAKSLAAEAWSDSDQTPFLNVVPISCQIELWEPFGVSNLNGLKMSVLKQGANALQSISYSLLSMPGYRSHCVTAGVGKYFQNYLFLEQKIGIGIHESGFANRAQWFLFSQTNVWLKASEFFYVIMELTNWPDLFCPVSDHIPVARMDLSLKQKVNEFAFVGLKLRIAADAGSQLMVFSGYEVSKKHELFGGLTLNPIGFSFGYGFKGNGLVIRFLLESGNVFGYAPYSFVSWRPE